jgi:hypothetical protein
MHRRFSLAGSVFEESPIELQPKTPIQGDNFTYSPTFQIPDELDHTCASFPHITYKEDLATKGEKLGIEVIGLMYPSKDL